MYGLERRCDTIAKVKRSGECRGEENNEKERPRARGLEGFVSLNLDVDLDFVK